MDDVQLANWYAGYDQQSVEAFRLFESVLLNALKVKKGTIVWLSDHTLTKTKFAHAEIEFDDYCMLPEILDNGLILPGNKRKSVEIIHMSILGYPYRFWRVCLKSTSKEEVFLDSFHRTRAKEARRLYRRAIRNSTLLRDHKNSLVQAFLNYTDAKA